MGSPFEATNFALIILAVIAGGIALVLTCVGISTANWQTTYGTDLYGDLFLNSTASFLYSCTLNASGEVMQCTQWNQNMIAEQYYPIDRAARNRNDWHRQLNAAAGLCIIGIIFVFAGTIATALMIAGSLLRWIFPVAPAMLFSACLFMSAGLAVGSTVLYYNGYSANLYQTGHLLTIFSFLCSAAVGGRLFDSSRSRLIYKSVQDTSSQSTWRYESYRRTS